MDRNELIELMAKAIRRRTFSSGPDAYEAQATAALSIIDQAGMVIVNREALEKAKVLIGARNDTLSEAQRQGNVNSAWHILNAALQDQPR